MNHIMEMIKDFKTNIEQEKADQELILEYMELFDDLLTRNNRIAHFTSSPWIINNQHTKVLMVYHSIYKSWGWCGGHVDGDSDFVRVALKEGKEETGIEKLMLLKNEPIALDVLPVPPHFKNGEFVSAHLHLNITYLCEANEKECLKIKPDENSDVAWISLEDIEHMVSEEDMKVVYKKLIYKSAELLNNII